MPNNQARNSNTPSSSSSRPDIKYARMKKATKTAFKKLGPFVLTGLAAVAEHHWLKKDDEEERHSRGGHSREEPSSRDKHQEQNGEAEVQGLRAEVVRLRQDLNRANREDRARAPPPVSPSLARDPRFLHAERGPREEEEEEEEEEEGFVRMPPAPTPPVSFPAPFPAPFPEREARASRPPQLYDPPSSARSPRDRRGIHPRSGSRSRSRRRHQRRCSVPRRVPHHPEATTSDAWHAGKVAAVAGLVEALHVDGGKGGWVGAKGLRVGTTAAASFGSTYVWERDPEHYRMREVLADVGTGVLVSRLVYGKATQGERGRRPGGGGDRRRWTFCL